MKQDELATIANSYVTMAIAASEEVCNEFKHRFPNDEPLIEELRLRQREAMTLVIPIPEVQHSSK